MRLLAPVVALCVWACAAQRASADQPQARVFVDAAHVVGRAPAHFSGHFFEIMHDSVIGGIWAEQLRDRSFEEADRNDDGAPDAWRPVGGATFEVDGKTAVPWFEGGRDHSQRIEATGAAGIEQGGLVLRKDEAYEVGVWLKQAGLQGPVTVALTADDGAVHARREFAQVSGDWSHFACRLEPGVDDEAAAFSIRFEGPGTLWVDKASVMPESAVHGFRADVVKAIKALKPTVIRFPGGNFTQGYHWTDGVGARDLRPATVNAAWGFAPEGNEMGTDEFVALCREVGAEPMICVGIGDTGSARKVADNSTERAFRDALAWLEYCNGDASTPWGRRRAENGHPEPYHVKYWEIGNELWGEWEIGHVDAWTYAVRFREFAKALREQDPTIEIFACGYDVEWNRTLFEVAPEEVDWLVLHHYFRSGSFADCVAEPGNYARFIDETREMAERMRPDRPLRISFNEWNTSFGPEMNHSLMAGMWAASLLNEMIRRGDTVQMLNVSDLVNGWNGGIIQAHPRGLYVTPNYEIIRMHAHNQGPLRVKTSVRCPTFDAPGQGRGHDVLDVVATRSESGDRLYVSVVNKSLEPVEAQIALDGCRVTGPAEVWTLTAPEVAAYNSLEHPEDVTLSPSTALRVNLAKGLVRDSRQRRVNLAVLGMTGGGTGTGLRMTGSASATHVFPGPSLTVFSVPVAGAHESATVESMIEGAVDVPGAAVWAEDGGSRVEARADGEGRYALQVSPGLWRVSATARGRDIATAETVEVTSERPGRADFVLPGALAPAGAVGADFDGDALPEFVEAAYLAGGQGGSWQLQEGALMLKGGRDTRYGLLSDPIPWSAEQATVVEAKVERYSGTNALLVLYGGSGAGDYSHYCEVGIEHGRAQVWATDASVTGEEVRLPAALRMVVGPPRADGRRFVDCYVNDTLLQRIPAYADLGAEPLRAFIYGWGESETVWDWVRATPAEAAALDGTVRDAEGAPVEGAWVDALGIAGAHTDAQGRYLLAGLPAGATRVVAGGGPSAGSGSPPPALAGPPRATSGGGEFGLVEREVAFAMGQVATADFEVRRIPSQGVLFDDFSTLDESRWTVRRIGAGRCNARAQDGALALQSERGSAIVVLSRPTAGSAEGEVTVEARVSHFVGEALTLHVGSGQLRRGTVDWSLRDGGLQARDGRRLWWPAEARISMPCDLKVVISAPDGQGRRSASLWYNGVLRHTFEGVESLTRGEDLAVGLGGGNCSAKWDWVAVTVRP